MKSVQVNQPVNGPVVGPTRQMQIQPPAVLSLQEASSDYQPPLVISTFGGPGVGKSSLIGTMPGDIGALMMENKSKFSIVRAAQSNGKKVVVPVDPATGREMSFIRVDNPMLLMMLPDNCLTFGTDKAKGMTAPQVQEEMQALSDQIRIDGPQPMCCKRHYYRWTVNRAKWALWQMASAPNVRGIAVDTFGQLVQDVSYANFGKWGVLDPKEFGFAPREDMNAEIRELLNSICHKHLILTHQSKAVWKDGKPVPGKSKPDSQFGSIGHYATLMIEQWRNDTLKADEYGRYGLTVMDCQANAALIGRGDLVWDDGITFQMLAALVYPDGDPDAYE